MHIQFQQSHTSIPPPYDAEAVRAAIVRLLGADYYYSHCFIDEQSTTVPLEQLFEDGVPETVQRVEVIALPAHVYVRQVVDDTLRHLRAVRLHLRFLAFSVEDQLQPSTLWESIGTLRDDFHWLLMSALTVERSVVRTSHWQAVMQCGDALIQQLPPFEHALATTNRRLIFPLLHETFPSILDEWEAAIHTAKRERARTFIRHTQRKEET